MEPFKPFIFAIGFVICFLTFNAMLASVDKLETNPSDICNFCLGAISFSIVYSITQWLF